MDNNWIVSYLEKYKKHIFREDIVELLYSFYERALLCQKQGGKLIFAGNGASAGIASHLALDFSKQGKVRSITFSDASLITCLSNDFGYENWVAKALNIYADPHDVVVLISSSGKSSNIVNAAEFAKSRDMDIVTFSGFNEKNPLRKLGTINFWVQSKAYNIIENTHMIWGTTVIDMLVGKAEYSVIK